MWTHVPDQLCDCRADVQTMEHIMVNECLMQSFRNTDKLVSIVLARQDSNGFEFVVEFGFVTRDRAINLLRVIFNPLGIFVLKNVLDQPLFQINRVMQSLHRYCK